MEQEAQTARLAVLTVDSEVRILEVGGVSGFGVEDKK